jgi:hypothetical protein
MHQELRAEPLQAKSSQAYSKRLAYQSLACLPPHSLSQPIVSNRPPLHPYAALVSALSSACVCGARVAASASSVCSSSALIR